MLYEVITPSDVATLIHESSQRDLINAARLAHFLGREQGRTVILRVVMGNIHSCLVRAGFE